MPENKSMILFAVAWILCTFVAFPAHAMEKQQAVPSSKTDMSFPVPDSREPVMQGFPEQISSGEQTVMQAAIGSGGSEHGFQGVFSSIRMNFPENAAGFLPEINRSVPGAVTDLSRINQPVPCGTRSRQSNQLSQGAVM
jgi:hypothetical protein